MTHRPFSVAALLALSTFFAAESAQAFCRTMPCSAKDPALACSRDANGCLVSETGRPPLYWPSSCVSFGVQRDGSRRRGIDYETTHRIVVEAFETWVFADCGGGRTPSLTVKDYGKIVCDEREYNADQGNANVFMYRDDGWPYENAEDTLALTTITYNKETSEIYDADVEINSFDANLTTSDTLVMADLSSILTHEIGHFLGLSHSSDPSATMRPGYRPGRIDLRTLAADDVAGICSLYAPDRELPPQTCEPRHGFSRECATIEEGCSVNGVPSSPTRSGGLLALAIVGLTGLRRWGRRRVSRG
jgi:hypothetical protein